MSFKDVERTPVGKFYRDIVFAPSKEIIAARMFDYLPDGEEKTQILACLPDEKTRIIVLVNTADVIVRRCLDIADERELTPSDILCLTAGVQLRKLAKRVNNAFGVLSGLTCLSSVRKDEITARFVDYWHQRKLIPRAFTDDDRQLIDEILAFAINPATTRSAFLAAHGTTSDFLLRRQAAYKETEQHALAILFSSHDIAQTVAYRDNAYPSAGQAFSGFRSDLKL